MQVAERSTRASRTFSQIESAFLCYGRLERLAMFAWTILDDRVGLCRREYSLNLQSREGGLATEDTQVVTSSAMSINMTALPHFFQIPFYNFRSTLCVLAHASAFSYLAPRRQHAVSFPSCRWSAVPDICHPPLRYSFRS